MVRQNLFLIVFYCVEDLEKVLEGSLCLFRRQLVVFGQLLSPTEQNKIKLVHSPFWIKMGPCPPDYDKNDLLQAVGSTFGGVLGLEIVGEFCRFKVNLDV